jgi:folate-binding protein YgfZ
MPGIAEEYRIVASGAGWIERPARGRIRFEGADSASFLQALLSNDVVGVAPGAGVYATYLTPLGRMITDLDVLNRGSAIVAVVPNDMGSALAARFDQLIFSEAVTVTDESDRWTEIVVTGGRAAEVVAEALSVDAAQLLALPELSQLDVADGFVVRGGESPWPLFRVTVATEGRRTSIDALTAAGARPMSDELADALRVEAGRPVWGRDLTPDTIPLEAGLLDRAISTAKGCYVGQEIIIRILHRGGGRVAKRLMTLAFDSRIATPPAPGAKVIARDQVAGHVTSAVWSPASARVIALAYVHRESAEIGTVLTVEGIEAPATVERAAG